MKVNTLKLNIIIIMIIMITTVRMRILAKYFIAWIRVCVQCDEL